MKFSPWQLVCILLVLLAAVICAHMFAPGSTATIVSMATTLFAALFVQRAPSAPAPGENFKVIDGGKKDEE